MALHSALLDCLFMKVMGKKHRQPPKLPRDLAFPSPESEGMTGRDTELQKGGPGKGLASFPMETQLAARREAACLPGRAPGGSLQVSGDLGGKSPWGERRSKA